MERKREECQQAIKDLKFDLCERLRGLAGSCNDGIENIKQGKNFMFDNYSMESEFYMLSRMKVEIQEKENFLNEISVWLNKSS